MNLFRFLLISLALTTIFIYACGEQAPVKIGFLGSTSGRAAGVCISARNGVQLAVESINAQGGINGRQVELVVFDDQHDEARVREGVKFLSDSGVVAIIGPVTSQMSVAAVPEANKRKVVLISPTTSTVVLSGLDDHFFRVYPTCMQNARALADQAVTVNGNKRLAIVADFANETFTTPWQHCFIGRLSEIGGEVVKTLSFNSQEKDVSLLSLAKEIVATRPDGILVLTNSIDAAMFSQQVSKLADGIDLYGSDWAFSGDLVRYGGKSIEGFTFTTNVDMESNTVAFKQFKVDFTKRFDAKPKFPTVLAYEAAQLLFSALRQNPDPANLPETLKNLGAMEGLQDSFQLDKNGDVERPTYINQVQKGHFIRLGTK